GFAALPSTEICRSPRESCSHREAPNVETAVTSERPSGATAIPSSAVGPAVICSGLPSGKRWRQMWPAPTAFDVKYIQFPSGDHAANVQAPPGGPTLCPEELPSAGT